MITDEIKKDSYRILNEFINAINSQNFEILNTKFSVNKTIFEEIKEKLDGYFGTGYIIEVAPFQNAFDRNKNRPNIDIYEMNESCVFGLECVIWLRGKPREPILHAEVFGKIGDLCLHYKYIGS